MILSKPAEIMYYGTGAKDLKTDIEILTKQVRKIDRLTAIEVGICIGLSLAKNGWIVRFEEGDDLNGSDD